MVRRGLQGRPGPGERLLGPRQPHRGQRPLGDPLRVQPEDLATASMPLSRPRSSRRNEVHGNSYGANRGGISAADTQNALIRDNVFGATTIAGVAYRANASKPGAVKASDSGRSSRTDFGTWRSWTTS